MLKAKEPLLFLSSCIELKIYYKDPNNFINRLPIYKYIYCRIN